MPERLIVADASPLIGLAKIGRLSLLRRLAEEVWIPRAVWRELIEGGSDRPEVKELSMLLTGSVRESEPTMVGRFAMLVDAGEAEAVALAAVNPGCLLLIDDAAGRRLAESQGIRCMGVAGLLLRAKRSGLLTALATDLKALREKGYFLSEHLIAQLLAAANE